MKKIISASVLGSLLMASSVTLANFESYVPTTKNIPENGVLSVTRCTVEDTKNAPKELLAQCNGEYIETVGTGTLISEEDMKKMEKMSDKEKMEYLDAKYPSKLPEGLGKLESSGFIDASSKNEKALSSDKDVGVQEMASSSNSTLISEEDMKKMEKMSDKEKMEYLESKYPSKLPLGLGTVEYSGIAQVSKDVSGITGKIDEFYQSKVLSLSQEKQAKVTKKLKERLESKVKSTKSKKKAKTYQDILTHIEANWSTR